MGHPEKGDQAEVRGGGTILRPTQVRGWFGEPKTGTPSFWVLGRESSGWDGKTLDVQWVLALSPAMNWGPGCPSHTDRGQVWLPEPRAASTGAPDLLLKVLRKCTGDSGGQVNLGVRGQATGPGAALSQAGLTFQDH